MQEKGIVSINIHKKPVTFNTKGGMMSEEIKDNYWQDAVMKWLTGAIYAPIKIIGPHQVKVMTRGMALVFASATMKDTATSEQTEALKGESDENVLKEYCKIEQKSGLIEDSSEIEVLPSEDYVTLKFRKCPYGKLCNGTIAALLARGDFNKKSIPCLRSDTYSAFLSLINGSRRPYKLVQFAPGAVCECRLEPQRQRRVTNNV